MTKNNVSHAPYSGNVHVIVIYGHKYKTIISLGMFFVFSKFWYFWVVRRVKGQKMTQNNKRLYLSHSISHEPYIIWLWFVVHKCKMIASPDDFLIYSNILIFWVVSRIKGQKMTKKKKKLCLTRYLRNCTSYDCGFWYTCVKWWYLQQFFSSYSNFWLLRVLRGVGVGVKKAENDS